MAHIESFAATPKTATMHKTHAWHERRINGQLGAVIFCVAEEVGLGHNGKGTQAGQDMQLR